MFTLMLSKVLQTMQMKNVVSSYQLYKILRLLKWKYNRYENEVEEKLLFTKIQF